MAAKNVSHALGLHQQACLCDALLEGLDGRRQTLYLPLHLCALCMRSLPALLRQVSRLLHGCTTVQALAGPVL